ncbi:hypothetical protein Enr13x_31700 [Stieleria neptunia]|uniref:Uncharacterized protein n=1 Tax=Stieleria neptunia TaxID=2527979 RepID=A0A518HR42_9BACT|nr:GxxExxY protein [Stieleria neptunia]QDV43315.1 hypothetical protein Enr13x_31700 [Stieleria neptunia]
MPVEVLGEVRAVEEQVFADVCYKVMGRVFAVRKTMGPFFRELIYQKKICESFPQTQVEVPIIVSQDQFRQEYYLDTVFDAVAVFEWKAVQRLNSRHRAQLLNYLMLCELERGKLVNLRPETIEHEFVNSPLSRKQRQSFALHRSDFIPQGQSEQDWTEFMVAALRDWGTGLDLHLYESATEHIFGGAEKTLQEVAVHCGRQFLGNQKTRITPEGSIVKVTALNKHKQSFLENIRRFLRYVKIPVVQWLNISSDTVTFQTIRRS